MNYIIPLEEFKIHGVESSKVLVFDIDDTLIKSNAKVFVKSGDRVVRTLDSQEFNEYQLQSGEEFCFDEFKDLNILLQSEIKPYFHTMRREYENGVHISILTARSGKDMIREFFLRKGIDIHPDLIFTTGDDTSLLSVSKKKSKCIRTLARYGYKTLIFFDDNVDNLRDVKKMGDKLNITIHTVKA